MFPDSSSWQTTGRFADRSDMLFPVEAPALHLEGGDEGEAAVRHQALQDHRYGQLHARQEQHGADGQLKHLKSPEKNF